jgi:alkylation response protein AidB-like acyl-CoA dehydrogenase
VRISATKSWVTSAGHAQSYIVSSLSLEGEISGQPNLYLVPAGAPGLSVAGPWDGLGLRANASAPMTAANVQHKGM